MSRVWEGNKKLLTGLAFALCLVMAISITMGLLPKADAANKAGDYSFGAITQAAAQFFNKTQSPENGIGLPDIGLLTLNADAYTNADSTTNCYFGNAGALIGYQDEFDTNSSFIVSGTEAGNTVIYQYSTLRNNVRIADAPSPGSGFSFMRPGDAIERYEKNLSNASSVLFSGYGYFGYALSELGLDETAMGGGNNLARMVLGSIIMALYAMSVSVNVFFDLVFTVLSWANPFRLFLGGLNYASESLMNFTGKGNATGGLIGPDPSANGIAAAIGTGIGEFADFLTVIHNTLYRLSFAVIIPLFIGVALFTWLVVKKGSEFGKIFKPLAIRVVFIAIGVPLMFMIYSAGIDLVKDFSAVSNSVGHEVVFSTFLDFEKWVDQSRLGTNSVGFGADVSSPYGSSKYMDSPIVVYVDETGRPSVGGESIAQARAIVYTINAENYGSSILSQSPQFQLKRVHMSNGTDSSEEYEDSVSTMQGYDRYFMDKGNYVAGTADNVGKQTKAIGSAIDLLRRYIAGDVVTAAGYQSKFTSDLLKSASVDSGDTSKLEEAFVEYTACYSWEGFHPGLAGPVSFKKGDGSTSFGSLNDFERTTDQMRQRAKDRFSPPSYLVTALDALTPANHLWGSGGLYMVTEKVSDTSGRYRILCKNGFGLSGVAMYNYLSSSFDGSKITVYSASNTTSNQVQVGHYAVTSVGSGLIRVIYLLDAICLLGCVTVLGYGYGFGLVRANFKVIMKLIPNVFSGMVGSLKGIASCLALLAAMIAELVCTFLLYYVGCEVIYMVYQLIEAPLAILLKTVFASSGSFVGTILPIVFGVISIAVIYFITMKLLKLRVAVCKSVTEACTSVIGKFVGVGVQAPDLHDGMSMANIASMGISAGMVATAAAGGPGELRDKISAIGKKSDGTTGGEGLSVDGDVGGTSDTESGFRGLFGEKPGSSTSIGDTNIDGAPGADGFAKPGVGGPGTDGDDKALKAGEAATGGDFREDVDGSLDVEGGAGKNAETLAAEYVEEHQSEFERMVAEAAEQNQARLADGPKDAGEKAKALKVDDAARNRGDLRMTDSAGNQVKGLQVVRSDTGENYSKTDKDEGAAFTVLDADGNVFRDAAGRSYENMSADHVGFNNDTGELRSIQTADGKAKLAVMAESDVGKLNVTDGSGRETSGVKVVSAETGEVYTMMDQAEGKAFNVVNQDGSIYVDSDGNRYENVDASMVEMSRETGQVTRFGTTGEDGEVVVNVATDGNEAAYGYTSKMTSMGASDLIKHPEGPAAVQAAQSGGQGGGGVYIAKGGDKTDIRQTTEQHSHSSSQVKYGDTYSDTQATVGGVQYVTKDSGQPGHVSVDSKGGGVVPVVIPGSQGGQGSVTQQTTQQVTQQFTQSGGGQAPVAHVNVRPPASQAAAQGSHVTQNLTVNQQHGSRPMPTQGRDTVVHERMEREVVKPVGKDIGPSRTPQDLLSPKPAPAAPTGHVTERVVETRRESHTEVRTETDTGARMDSGSGRQVPPTPDVPPVRGDD